ncbi:hypothetical protein BpHYR1_028973 [Brachionus plicatilis]|uniref:Uncharacterized protein n=1 Tax=Brachionus plicatilis TaxID=10195 RepID=A0A3M7RUI9_BRAPC|nr:hypothetical protein BpHYR1_028973 [Brachionus plicatilis]
MLTFRKLITSISNPNTDETKRKKYYNIVQENMKNFCSIIVTNLLNTLVKSTLKFLEFQQY